MVYNAIALFVNVILNVVLIPIYGIVGAAVALCAGYLIMNLIKSWDLFVTHDISVINTKNFIPVVFSFIFYFPPLYLVENLSLVAEFIFSGIIWISSIIISIFVLYITGRITDKDINIIYIFVPDIITPSKK
jgi:O-antigen/teichoic acid export membrane protein